MFVCKIIHLMEIIKINPHAEERAKQRGAAINEIEQTVMYGEKFPAKHGRSGFRRNFNFGGKWNGIFYESKQLEVYAVGENGIWIVITVIVKYF